MLAASADLADRALEEHLGVHFDGLEFVFFFPIAEHVIVSHAPGIKLIGVLVKSIAVVASRKNTADVRKFLDLIRFAEIVNSV